MGWVRRGRTVFSALALAAVAVVALVALGSATGIGGGAGPEIASQADEPSPQDELAYDEERRAAFEESAVDGLSHVVYANSPGGAEATAERVARFRDQIEAATAGTDVDPDVVEALVYLESAGRPEVIAGRDPELASGLTQIVASTGLSLLDMRIDLERSRKLTVGARRALRRGDTAEVERLLRERAKVDERFDADKALAATVDYLTTAQERFRSEDLAAVSYHMGIGNLESVIENYTGSEGRSADAAAGDLSYAELYFGSSLTEHPEAWELLAAFGDESSEYYWKLLASREIMRLYREDRNELRELERLNAEKATAEEVYHPRGETEVFADPDELADAWRDADIVPIPQGEELGYVLDPGIGELAPELDVAPELYQGLRPEALEMLILIAGWVRDLNGGGALTVSSAVRDREYQRQLGKGNVEATSEYSLHTTGWSFDVLREYESDSQAGSFQFVLDRLQALGLIDYAVEPSAIHVTVAERPGPP
jgi:hypothetical protein